MFNPSTKSLKRTVKTFAFNPSLLVSLAQCIPWLAVNTEDVDFCANFRARWGRIKPCFGALDHLCYDQLQSKFSTYELLLAVWCCWEKSVGLQRKRYSWTSANLETRMDHLSGSASAPRSHFLLTPRIRSSALSGNKALSRLLSIGTTPAISYHSGGSI
jgi:hypothetical protein